MKTNKYPDKTKKNIQKNYVKFISIEEMSRRYKVNQQLIRLWLNEAKIDWKQYFKQRNIDINHEKAIVSRKLKLWIHLKNKEHFDVLEFKSKNYTIFYVCQIDEEEKTIMDDITKIIIKKNGIDISTIKIRNQIIQKNNNKGITKFEQKFINILGKKNILTHFGGDIENCYTYDKLPKYNLLSVRELVERID